MTGIIVMKIDIMIFLVYWEAFMKLQTFLLYEYARVQESDFKYIIGSEPLLFIQQNKFSHKICHVSSMPGNFIFYKNSNGVIKKSYGAYVEELNLMIQCTHPQYGSMNKVFIANQMI